MLRHPSSDRTRGEPAHQSTYRGTLVPIRKRRPHWSWIVAIWARQSSETDGPVLCPSAPRGLRAIRECTPSAPLLTNPSINGLLTRLAPRFNH
jgi:hypothetical protein